MNNLLSYCGSVDARISASEKDLPVLSVLSSCLVLGVNLGVSKSLGKGGGVALGGGGLEVDL